MTDLNKREVISFLPLLVLTVILGVYPNPVLKVLEPSVQKLVGQVQGTNAVVPAPVQEDTVIILPEPGEEVLAPAPTAPAPSDVTAPAVPGEQPVTVPADAASANAPAEADAEVAKEALEDTTEKEQVPPAELPKNQNSKESE